MKTLFVLIPAIVLTYACKSISIPDQEVPGGDFYADKSPQQHYPDVLISPNRPLVNETYDANGKLIPPENDTYSLPIDSTGIYFRISERLRKTMPEKFREKDEIRNKNKDAPRFVK